MQDDLDSYEFAAARCRSSLRLAPELLMHVYSLVTPGGGASDGMPRGKSDAPAPLRLAPLDDLDEAFAVLASWLDEWQEKLGRGLVVPISSLVWANRNGAQGIRGVSSPGEVFEAATVVTSHLLAWDAAIFGHEASAEYYRSVNETVWNLSRRYPLEAGHERVRAAEPRACPVCGVLAVGVRWWGPDDTDLEVTCDACKAVIEAPRLQVREWLRKAQIG